MEGTWQEEETQIEAEGAKDQGGEQPATEEGALLRELEDLRAENQILKDSMVEFRPDEPGSADEGGDGHNIEKVIQDLSSVFTKAMEQTKKLVSPGTDKLTALLSHQMEENPIPVLLAAFGAGYLVGRRKEKE